MDKFQVIQPSPLLAPYVRQYWFLTLENVKNGAQHFVPGESLILTFRREGLFGSCVTGHRTAFVRLVYSGHIDYISVVFQPAGAIAIFKRPLIEMHNRIIPVEALEDPRLTELEKRLKNEPDNETCVRLIENFLQKRIDDRTEDYHYRRLTSVIKSIARGQNDLSDLAQTACLGHRQFRRIFEKYIGTTPANYIRISRFQQAARLLQLRPRMTLTALSEECAYYDRSHLIREFKTLSGYTPGEFLSVCDPYSEYHSLFRSTWIDTKY